MSSPNDSPAMLFTNAKILHRVEPGRHAQPNFADSMLVRGSTIASIGSKSSASISPATITRDLGGRTVLPGFIDGHMHLLLLGQSLTKLSLEHCRSLPEIRAAIAAHAAAHPHLPRLACKGWLQSMTGNGGGHSTALASDLDDLDPRPIFVDSKDLHSTWCSSSALAELGVDDDTPDPPGGRIARDGRGKATGLLEEAAVLLLVWPHLGRSATLEERIDMTRDVLGRYHAAGYTGLVEMAMDGSAWEALCALRAQSGSLEMRVAAYWLVRPSASDDELFAQIDEAVRQRDESAATGDDLRIVGIKIITDGVVDGCTAHLAEPYVSNGESPPALWTPEALATAVSRADAAGLQIALHAIGDGAVRLAVDTLEKHSTPGRRHRIEHLELTSPEDAARLGRLGITASIQPVHADPVILRAWPRLLGHKRCGRAFAYTDFADGGATLALGSDSPTAPYEPLPNLYVATTRRSAREPAATETVNEGFRLGLCEAIVGATEGSARSVFWDGRAGRLDEGMSADFVVVDMQWEAEKLLGARIEETWFAGRKVWPLEN